MITQSIPGLLNNNHVLKTQLCEAILIPNKVFRAHEQLMMFSYLGIKDVELLGSCLGRGAMLWARLVDLSLLSITLFI